MCSDARILAYTTLNINNIKIEDGESNPENIENLLKKSGKKEYFLS